LFERSHPDDVGLFVRVAAAMSFRAAGLADACGTAGQVANMQLRSGEQ